MQAAETVAAEVAEVIDLEQTVAALQTRAVTVVLDDTQLRQAQADLADSFDKAEQTLAELKPQLTPAVEVPATVVLQSTKAIQAIEGKHPNAKAIVDSAVEQIDAAAAAIPATSNLAVQQATAKLSSAITIASGISEVNVAAEKAADDIIALFEQQGIHIDSAYHNDIRKILQDTAIYHQQKVLDIFSLIQSEIADAAKSFAIEPLITQHVISLEDKIDEALKDDVSKRKERINRKLQRTIAERSQKLADVLPDAVTNYGKNKLRYATIDDIVKELQIDAASAKSLMETVSDTKGLQTSSGLKQNYPGTSINTLLLSVPQFVIEEDSAGNRKLYIMKLTNNYRTKDSYGQALASDSGFREQTASQAIGPLAKQFGVAIPEGRTYELKDGFSVFMSEFKPGIKTLGKTSESRINIDYIISTKGTTAQQQQFKEKIRKQLLAAAIFQRMFEIPDLEIFYDNDGNIYALDFEFLFYNVNVLSLYLDEKSYGKYIIDYNSYLKIIREKLNIPEAERTDADKVELEEAKTKARQLYTEIDSIMNAPNFRLSTLFSEEYYKDAAGVVDKQAYEDDKQEIIASLKKITASATA